VTLIKGDLPGAVFREGMVAELLVRGYDKSPLFREAKASSPQ
jgi:hypothetical protein